jgi:hypothetical protein
VAAPIFLRGGPVDEHEQLRHVQEHNPHRQHDARVKCQHGRDQPGAQARPHEDCNQTKVQRDRAHGDDQAGERPVREPEAEARRNHLILLTEHDEPATHVFRGHPFQTRAVQLRVPGDEVHLAEEELQQTHGPLIVSRRRCGAGTLRQQAQRVAAA